LPTNNGSVSTAVTAVRPAADNRVTSYLAGVNISGTITDVTRQQQHWMLYLEHALLTATGDPALLSVPCDAFQLRVVWYGNLFAATKDAYITLQIQLSQCDIVAESVCAYLKYENMISSGCVPAAVLSASFNNNGTLARRVSSRRVRAKCLLQPRFSPGFSPVQLHFTQAASACWRFIIFSFRGRNDVSLSDILIIPVHSCVLSSRGRGSIWCL